MPCAHHAQRLRAQFAPWHGDRNPVKQVTVLLERLTDVSLVSALKARTWQHPST
jgi:hypothetical protein